MSRELRRDPRGQLARGLGDSADPLRIDCPDLLDRRTGPLRRGRALGDAFRYGDTQPTILLHVVTISLVPHLTSVRINFPSLRCKLHQATDCENKAVLLDGG